VTDQEKLIDELAGALSLALKEMTQHAPDDCDCPRLKEAFARGWAAVEKAKKASGRKGKWSYE
jgi:hypothetical protein